MLSEWILNWQFDKTQAILHFLAIQTFLDKARKQLAPAPDIPSLSFQLQWQSNYAERPHFLKQQVCLLHQECYKSYDEYQTMIWLYIHYNAMSGKYHCLATMVTSSLKDVGS